MILNPFEIFSVSLRFREIGKPFERALTIAAVFVAGSTTLFSTAWLHVD
jgi:hypothetical protein